MTTDELQKTGLIEAKGIVNQINTIFKADNVKASDLAFKEQAKAAYLIAEISCVTASYSFEANESIETILSLAKDHFNTISKGCFIDSDMPLFSDN